MYNGNKDNDMTISIGKKLYEEKDYPLESKIISEDKISDLIQRESSWRGESKDLTYFLTAVCKDQAYLLFIVMVYPYLIGKEPLFL